MVGSDASDVMQRVTGVSIVDNKYVYIRGLGERYSSPRLNGAVVPSTRPDKKVVPMDLFPAALMQNIRTEKSYTPDQPGEFSGGLVKMNTVDFPRSPVLKLSYGTSFGSTTTFKDFADYPGGSRDWLGFDDGTRSLPSGIPNQRLTRRGRFSNTGFTPDELQGFGQSCQQRLDASWWSERDSQPEFQLHGRQHLRQVGRGPGPFPRQQVAPATGEPELLPFGRSGEAHPPAGI